MVKELLNTDAKNLLFLDIETASNKKTITSSDPEYDSWAWKTREKDFLKPEDEVIREYERRAALYSCFSRIICITVGFIKDDKIYLKTLQGEEADILKEFVTIVSESGKTLVLWNAPFDVPTIRKRFMINGLKDYLSNQSGNDSMKKPWTLAGVLDLMDVWKGISFASESMDEVALAFGLPSPKASMKGSEVSEAFYRGEIDKIVDYNQEDVKTLANLYRVFTYQTPITEVIVKKDIARLPLIQRIFSAGEIKQEEEIKLTQFIATLNKDEVKDLEKILAAAFHPNEIPITIRIHL